MSCRLINSFLYADFLFDSDDQPSDLCVRACVIDQLDSCRCVIAMHSITPTPLVRWRACACLFFSNRFPSGSVLVHRSRGTVSHMPATYDRLSELALWVPWPFGVESIHSVLKGESVIGVQCYSRALSRYFLWISCLIDSDLLFGSFSRRQSGDSLMCSLNGRRGVIVCLRWRGCIRHHVLLLEASLSQLANMPFIVSVQHRIRLSFSLWLVGGR